MNDFEMQRRLRGMNTARAPRSDLWPAIATRIATRGTEVEAMPRRRFHLPLAAAAALLLAVTAGVLLQDRHAPPAMPVADATPAADARESLRISPREAADIARARGSDPRVLGAAVVLDSAQDQLAQALEQRPDAVFLVSLLNRTHAQRMKLERFGASAG